MNTSNDLGSAPTTLWHHARLATLHPNTQGDPWGMISDGALVTQGSHIVWVGAKAKLPATPPTSWGKITHEIDLGGALLTPGLVDCHTHLIYGGHRATEFEKRLNGVSYEQIAQAGGGIRSTVQATRQASTVDLFSSASRRLQALMAEGVTTVEIKSGYGLDLETEARCLQVARNLGTHHPVTVRSTYLGAHTLPLEYQGQADAYITKVCEYLPQLHALELVDAVDVFCDIIGFSTAQTKRVFEAARALHLPVKLHAEQLSNQEGAALAASFHALSCDHLEHLSPSGIQAMRDSGTVAVLLPGAYYTLRETHLPPVQALRDAGIPIALATDHNPGSSPTLSLLLMAHMACTLFRLTPLEAILGITAHGAQALGLNDRGRIATGLRADLVAWELEHPCELAYWYGYNPCLRVFVGAKERLR